MKRNDNQWIFLWGRRYRKPLRMFFFIFLATFCHALFFYAVQVTEDGAPKSRTETHQILLLSRNDPKSTQLIHQLVQRMPNPTWMDRDLQSDHELPQFQLSFTQKAETSGVLGAANPKWLPRYREERVRDEIRLGVGNLLPPLESFKVTKGSERTATWQWVMDRELMEALNSSWTSSHARQLPALEQVNPVDAVFWILISPDGRVRDCLPTFLALETPGLDQVIRTLKQIRFNPVQGAQWREGTVRMQLVEEEGDD